MEKKQIRVKEVEYEFFYDENLNMWRIIESPYLIENHSIDVEIDLGNFKSALDWQDVVKFIGSIKNNHALYVERLNDSKQVLKSLFHSINKNYDDDFMSHVEFNLSGIDFKGNCEIVNLEDRFLFDYFFFPQYTKDPSKDIGSFVWRANFRDTLLLGVYCERI